MRPRGQPKRLVVEHRPGLAVYPGAALPRDTDAVTESITVFGPSLSILVTAAAADGSIFRSGGISEFSKYNATREKFAAA